MSTGFCFTKGMWVDTITSVPSAEWFDAHYARQRKPVKIRLEGGLASLGWKTDQWTAEYLKHTVGTARIKAETPRSKAKHASHGLEPDDVEVTLAELLDELVGTPPTSATPRSLYMNLQVRADSPDDPLLCTTLNTHVKGGTLTQMARIMSCQLSGVRVHGIKPHLQVRAELHPWWFPTVRTPNQRTPPPC